MLSAAVVIGALRVKDLRHLHHDFKPIYLAIQGFYFIFFSLSLECELFAMKWSFVNFCYEMGFFLIKQSKNLDLSYKTDLDFWDCFVRENPLLIPKERR